MVTAPGNNCHNTSTAVSLNVVVGMDEALSTGTMLFPVPATDRLHVQRAADAAPVPYRLLDMRGAVVQEGLLTGALTTLPVAHLASGLYVLGIGHAQAEERLRFVKEGSQ